MPRSIKDLERLEKELKERTDSADTLDRVQEVEHMLYPKQQPSRPLNGSTRGLWGSRGQGSLLFPRRKR